MNTRTQETTDMCICEDPTQFTRCDKHADMMKVVHAAWFGSLSGKREDIDRADRVEQFADGYEIVGFVPDWSGIRDSSVAAVEAMYAEAIR